MTSNPAIVTSGPPAGLYCSRALMLIGITLVPMVVLGLKGFGHGPLAPGASALWRAVAANMLFCCHCNGAHGPGRHRPGAVLVGRAFESDDDRGAPIEGAVLVYLSIPLVAAGDTAVNAKSG